MVARVVIFVWAMLCGALVHAQDAPERPWAAGVAPEQQERALAIFREGNELFLQLSYAPALKRYREALELWDHPGIHFNAAVSLINLDKPLSAYKQLEQALAFGEEPLGHDNHTQALLYKKLLAAQLAELRVECSEPQAQVMLDGELLFSAPGASTSLLLPGAHQLVARKPGLLTESRALHLPAGQLTREVVKLSAITAPKLQSVRRWDAWVPWVVLGAGVLVAAVGVPFAVSAEGSKHTFDDEIIRACPAGCRESELPESLRDERSSGQTAQALAIGLFIGGGLSAATGVVLMMLNQAHWVPVEERKPRAAFEVRALAAPGGAGLRAELRL
jgi:hypothetical protein